MKKIPFTYKDILKQNKNFKKHIWIMIGGGGKSNVRSWNPKIPETDSEIYIQYKCKNCDIKARRYISDIDIILENEKLINLSCEEIIIKSIIE